MALALRLSRKQGKHNTALFKRIATQQALTACLYYVDGGRSWEEKKTTADQGDRLTGSFGRY